MMMNTPLKYLFTALYEDGSSHTQTEDDVSAVDPIRSAYYDVLNSGKPLNAFVLRSVDGGTEAAVSLEDGHFEIDGRAFFVGDAPDLPAKFELVYFRRNFREFNLGLDQVGHRIHHYIGWKTEVDGEVVQRTIGLV
jgi:hypothetical protein